MAYFTNVVQAILTQAVTVEALGWLDLLAVRTLLLCQGWLMHALPAPPLLLIVISGAGLAHAIVPISIHLVAVVVCQGLGLVTDPTNLTSSKLLGGERCLLMSGVYSRHL